MQAGVAVLLLTAAAAPHTASAPAPRARELAFVCPSRGTPQICVIRSDGTGWRRLTALPGERTTPTWSPDGRRIAFVRREAGISQIATVRPDGRAPRVLTHPPASATAPAWAPDARRIAFVRTADGSPQIALMRGDGTTPRLLTHPPGARRAPAWSPDGRFIAFLSSEDHAPPALYLIRPDGSGRGRVPTRAPGLQPDVTGFAWLPDGRLAYTNRSGPAQEVVTVTTRDGTAQRFLGSASSPAWAPDGRRLAFVVSRVGGAQIYVRNSAGGPPVRLTDPRVISVRPVWSPDGRHIAFLVIDRGTVTLAVMDADGRHQRRLAEVSGDLSAPPLFSWRPW